MKWTVVTAVSLLLVASTACPPARGPNPPPGTRPAPNRLQGDWHVKSTLRVREGVAGPGKHLLEVSQKFQKLVDGELTIPGLPIVILRTFWSVSRTHPWFRGTRSGLKPSCLHIL